MNCIFNFFKKLFGSKSCTKNLTTCEKEDCCMLVKSNEVVEEPKLELITDVTASAPLTVVAEVRKEVEQAVEIVEPIAEVVKKPKRKYNKKPKTDNLTKKETKKVSKNKKDDK